MRMMMSFKWLVVLSVLGLCTLAGRAQAQQERQVTFAGAGGALLAGTLTLPDPAGKGAAPGLVLVAGSGPTDRDGNAGPEARTDLLKQIAERLAQVGIASLRYDKRGVRGSVMSLQDQAHLAAYAAWENFVGDGVAALRCLQRRPEVDAARTGFLGHSEGGLIALQAAGLTKDQPQPVSLLVLASTPGRRLDVVVQEQLARTLKKQHATPAQADYFLAKNRAIVSDIRETGAVPGDVPAGLAALYPFYSGKFYRSALHLDPAKPAAQFPGPVLILQGQKDVQVSPSRDAPALAAALGGRPHDVHRLFLVPGASHNLKPVAGADDPGLTGPVAPSALDVLGDWLRAQWKVNTP